MRALLTGLMIAWVLRPVSGRTLRRRIRRNASDPEFWAILTDWQRKSMGR